MLHRITRDLLRSQRKVGSSQEQNNLHDCAGSSVRCLSAPLRTPQFTVPASSSQIHHHARSLVSPREGRATPGSAQASLGTPRAVASCGEATRTGARPPPSSVSGTGALGCARAGVREVERGPRAVAECQPSRTSTSSCRRAWTSSAAPPER